MNLTYDQIEKRVPGSHIFPSATEQDYDQAVEDIHSRPKSELSEELDMLQDAGMDATAKQRMRRTMIKSVID